MTRTSRSTKLNDKSNTSNVNKLDIIKKIMINFKEENRGNLRLPINFFHTEEFISSYVCILNKKSNQYNFIQTKNITLYKDKKNNIFILVNRNKHWEDTIVYEDNINDALIVYSLKYLQNHNCII
jgi:hypothetical protein